jgi:predicted nucleic acid-binding protein
MPSYTFDTSVIISRKVSDIPDNFLFSAVVLLELIASAKDESERNRYEALARDYREDDSLIVPNFDDLVVGKQNTSLVVAGPQKKGWRQSTAAEAWSVAKNGI